MLKQFANSQLRFFHTHGIHWLPGMGLFTVLALVATVMLATFTPALQQNVLAKEAQQPVKGSAVIQAPSTTAATTAQAPRIQVTNASPREVQAILKLMDQLLADSNAHDIDHLLRHYSRDYVSGDNLKLEQVKKMVLDTWQQYPDIRYDSQVLEVRLNGNWATVETLDHAKATAKAPPQLTTEQTGQLTTESRNLIFLRRMGKHWLVESDNTLYERATMLFGDADQVTLGLSAPDQVFAGESFTARLTLDLPEGQFAIAGINQEQLVYPTQPSGDTFRTVGPNLPLLERVFEANNTNKNELITATVGLTEIGRMEDNRPTVLIKGIATLVKRVNVLARPASQGLSQSAMTEELASQQQGGTEDDTHQAAARHSANDTEAQVATSASGRVRVNEAGQLIVQPYSPEKPESSSPKTPVTKPSS